jgi:hypothetical protein
MTDMTRRGLLAGAGAAGIGLLAGCRGAAPSATASGPGTPGAAGLAGPGDAAVRAAEARRRLLGGRGPGCR